ncbi:S10 family peptidase [Streptomyces sp. NPDC058001]|uniref:S10 family peptidase n=1 Tax=Streptomyces sp. NPDC058001 TaxID=3346300 RepID=UPI0036EC6C79
MSNDEQKTKSDYEPPRGASTTGKWNDITYTATAEWFVLRKKEKPTAEVFSVAYIAQDAGPERPVTFVFNGGPGAGSAYLHLGVVGPQRVLFPADGSIPKLPPQLEHNEDSWLAFTDIVLIDPVGTGFSRVIEPDDAKNGADKPKDGPDHDPHQYFGTVRDLEAMCEFISGWLSKNRRWGAPLFVAGESYGGYRAGRLTRMLQEQPGVGLNGVILISPALEPAFLATGMGWGDYAVEPWIDLLPTMAATAAHHGRSRAFKAEGPLEDVLRAAEEFATGDYASFLTRGVAMPAEDRDRVINRYADLTGLDPRFVRRAEGRVNVHRFKKELLRDESKVVGAYDGTILAPDPFPDRDPYEGADPTLTAMYSVYTAAINKHLRSEIGLETHREYKLLSTDVIMNWKNDEAPFYLQGCPGAVDDFRYGMAMSPHTRAFITHGWYDLMTPYYTSDRMRNLMRLDESVANRLTVRHFGGGHMFYAWQESRHAFSAAIAAFVAEAT